MNQGNSNYSSGGGYGNAPRPPPQQSYGNPPPSQQPYGNPPPSQHPYGNPPPSQQPYGNPPPSQQPYGNPPPPQQPYGNRPPPPSAQQQQARKFQDEQLITWFQMVDTQVFYSILYLDRSGVLEAQELQRDFTPFSIETTRLMIGMFDRDRSGTIDKNEFISLWRYIEQWRDLFARFDQDRSGSIENRELYNALSAFGFQIPPRIVDSICAKIKVLDGAKRAQSGINLDRFIYACVFLKSATDSFYAMDRERKGYVTFNYEDFLSYSIRSP
ncbi:hypothetical protein BB560_005501 [Smittium megazygosporum]|uniref:Peflin n=1 Tax=Smittium megazygosporum TaxID=133381 RepID=A0A2T9Z494_9FUNG|nr:hypothetical protein BB560_005501 [Smittium megazygosporum]